MSDGFLSRWSRRKIEVKEGRPPVAEPAAAPAPSLAPIEPAAPVPVEEPPPTLEDVAALTPESDFRRFAARDVAPDVKNAALKKLFTDPRFNVMDGMDVYVGDYSQPDPLPESMLRQLASAKFLNLFSEEEEADEKAGVPRDVADNPTPQSVAQSPAVPPEVPTHADPDLRLQQDDAAPGEEPGRGTG